MKTLKYREIKLNDLFKKQEIKIQKKLDSKIIRKEKEHLRYINRKKLKECDIKANMIKV